MILTLFVVLLTIAIVLVGLGYFTGDSVYTFVGFFFLFILGTYLFTNNVEYRTGEIHYYEYGLNPCNYNCTLSKDTVIYEYDPYTGDYARWMGVLMSICGVLGMAFTFINFKRRRDNA